MPTPPDPQVRTYDQLLADFGGTQPLELKLRDFIATLLGANGASLASLTTTGAVTDPIGRLQALPRSTTAALEAVGNAINTTNKFAGKAVINTTTGAIVTAASSAAAGVWQALDGTTAHTPV